MIKKTFIFGATDLSLLLYRNLMSIGNDSVYAFVVDKEYKIEDFLFGLPVITSDKILDMLSPEEYDCYICLGYSKMNIHRKRVYDDLISFGYKVLNFFHPEAKINCDSIGNGNIVFSNVFIDFFTCIGNCNIFYPKAFIAHHNRIGNFNFFSIDSCVAGHVYIGDMNFIGANATISNNVTIDDSCLVGAGSYLYRDIKSYDVFACQRGNILTGKQSTDFI